MRVLVTGATGYVGGRLVPRLLEAGYQVRCLVRDPRKLEQDPWRDQVEVVQGDILEPATLDASLDGCEAAYYLVHSMDGVGQFADRDRTGAENFRKAADRAGVNRIVYLGGMGGGDGLSEHLSSRHEVGRILAGGATPVTELRAAVVIGSGSVSFEMLRYLTEVLPVMVTPRWVRTRCQPIAIRDVLGILVDVLDDPGEADHIYEIGGPDVLEYEQMMRIYAEEASLPRRLIVPVPVLSPKLSSHWVGLVTPIPSGIAKPLVDSLRNEVVVRDSSFLDGYPRKLLTYREAVGRALEVSEELAVPTRWSDAEPSPAQPTSSDPDWSGGTLYRDHREVSARASSNDLFWAFSRIGGTNGYYGFGWAWHLRGLADSLVGGVGLRRGRRHPEELRRGEALDFWRVAAVEPDRRLLLHAEMRLPGEAWLEFRADGEGDQTTLQQTAYFRPRGLLGRLYWAVLIPFHAVIFRLMAERIAAAAETRTELLPPAREWA
jgi:uncharacterized protein YbjT (DUF2867 family)